MPKKANIFDSFSHSAIQQFKEAFGIMDVDKDGLLSASDLTVSILNMFSFKKTLSTATVRRNCPALLYRSDLTYNVVRYWYLDRAEPCTLPHIIH